MLNRPIRVLYMIGGGEFGGAEQHVLSLIQGLDPNRCVAEVACFYEAQFSKRVRELGVRVTLLGRGSLWSVQRTLSAVIDTFKPDVIHTHGVRANLLGRTKGRLCRIPVITTVHSIFALDYPNKLKRAVFFALEKMTRPFVHTFIAVSQSIRDVLVREHVKDKKIHVIYNGIDTDYFVPSDTKVKSDPPTVVTVARLHAVKGHKLLLQAIPLVQTPAQYIFVGEGELRSELEQQIREHNLPVTLVGHQDEIVPYYQNANLVVQTSLSEGFSLSMAEALACGVPVVTTRVGGCVEIAKHIRTGVRLVPVQDTKELAQAIDEMLQHPEPADREAIVETFSVQQMCKNTMDLYESILRK
jgi:glycosyltransferase involved in cell wall biosynthesis